MRNLLLITISGLFGLFPLASQATTKYFKRYNYDYSGTTHSISYRRVSKNLQQIQFDGSVKAEAPFFLDRKGIDEVISRVKRGVDIELVFNANYGGDVGLFLEFGKALQAACHETTNYPTIGSQPDRPPKVDLSKPICHIKTHVTGLCGSACIPLYMIGHERTAEHDAEFTFHQTWVGTEKNHFCVPGHAQGTLQAQGVSSRWIKKNSGLFRCTLYGHRADLEKLIGSGILKSRYRTDQWATTDSYIR